MKSILPISLFSLLVLSPSVQAADADIDTYADAKGLLWEQETVKFLFAHLELSPDDASYGLKRSVLATRLENIKEAVGHGPPYTKAEIRKVLGISTALESYDDLSPGEKVPPFTEPYIWLQEDISHPSVTPARQKVGPKLRDRLEYEEYKDTLKAKGKPPLANHDIEFVSETSAGPFRVRRSVDDIRDGIGGIELTGPDPDIAEAKGAKISYSDNRLESGHGAVSSEGAVFFPVLKRTRQDRFGIVPAVSWNLQEQQTKGKEDLDELKFSVPLYYEHRIAKEDDYAILTLEPYYQTDTDLDGSIWGTTLSAAYKGNLFPVGDRYFRLNEWQFAFDTKVSYRLRGAALLDYSETHGTSRFSSRKENDDWFRIGADLGFDAAFFRQEGQNEGEGKITYGINYKAFDDLSGDGHYSDLFSTNLTWWMSKYTGLTLEYQKGETPIADEDVDLITLGLEFRY